MASIIETGVKIYDQKDKEFIFSAKGETNQISVNELPPNTSFKVIPYVVWGDEVIEGEPDSFSTLSGGTCIFTDNGSDWNTTYKGFDFDFDIKTDYNIKEIVLVWSDINNFESKVGGKQQFTLSADTTSYNAVTVINKQLPKLGENMYYRIFVVDEYNEMFNSELFETTVPTQELTIRSNAFVSKSIVEFQASATTIPEYAIAYNMVAYTDSQSEEKITKHSNGLNAVQEEIAPDYYTYSHIVVDVYGNEFKSDKLWFKQDNPIILSIKGGGETLEMEYKFLDDIEYTDAYLFWENSNESGQIQIIPQEQHIKIMTDEEGMVPDDLYRFYLQAYDTNQLEYCSTPQEFYLE